MIALLAAAAVVGPILSPYHPDTHQPALQYAGPSLSHPLGADFFGRDVLTRVFQGARISMGIACVSVLLSLTVGALVGLTAGMVGGKVDAVLMRGVDVILAFPRLFLLLMVAALWQGSGITPLMLVLVLGLTSWFDTSRLVRAQVLSLRERDFVLASRALGLPLVPTVLRHILPNVAGPILVSGALGVATMVLAEAGLSYLGLGIPQPTATLGRMIADGQETLRQAPWNALGPGIYLTLSVLTFAWLSEGLREANETRGSAR